MSKNTWTTGREADAAREWSRSGLARRSLAALWLCGLSTLPLVGCDDGAGASEDDAGESALDARVAADTGDPRPLDGGRDGALPDAAPSARDDGGPIGDASGPPADVGRPLPRDASGPSADAGRPPPRDSGGPPADGGDPVGDAVPPAPRDAQPDADGGSSVDTDGGRLGPDAHAGLDGGSSVADAAPSDGALAHADAGPSTVDGAQPDAGGSTGDAAVPDAGPPPEENAAPLFAERFDGPDGAPWPPPWRAIGGVDEATLVDGMACLRPRVSDYSLARMAAPLDATDVDVTFTLRFDDLAHQGVGFYVRQNGGYLRATQPVGAGYAVFVEGFRDRPGIGVWRERDGNEEPLEIAFDPGLGLLDDARFRVRFRVAQRDAATTLSARLWPEGEDEPSTWDVEAVDDTPELQGLAGGLAVDGWSNLMDPRGPRPERTCIDDLEVLATRHPLDGLGPVELIQDGFGFTEGPVWRDQTGDLLFSDIPNDQILRYVPGAGQRATPVIGPSGHANGLALDPQGRLVACEHAGRVVRRETLDAAPVVLAETFEGRPFHSPNDVVVRSDGTLYFTDPPYGRPGGAPGPMPFVGLFRRDPAGVLTAELRAGLGARLNGVALSPDERVLYATDTAAGTLLAWDVEADGALSRPRTLARGLASPDGLTVDAAGRLYLGTERGVTVLASDGSPWGLIPTPRIAANCELGGPDGGDLYITAREALYRVRVPAARRLTR